MIRFHKTGRYGDGRRTPAGDPARAILEVWIDDLASGAKTTSVPTTPMNCANSSATAEITAETVTPHAQNATARPYSPLQSITIRCCIVVFPQFDSSSV